MNRAEIHGEVERVIDVGLKELEVLSLGLRSLFIVEREL